jgi:Na+/H+ antiporter NhaD/arsenite permease-like protein
VSSEPQDVVELSPKKFLIGCALAALALLGLGRAHPFPAWMVAAEVVAVVLALFLFGSIKYRLDKNALTYGAVLVIAATVWESWWQGSGLKESLLAAEPGALWHFIHHHFLTLHGLDQLIHLDTMLFILGLTFFVACIAQTRLLETVSFWILNQTGGRVAVTVAILTGIVSFSSGILDGVSMIGLMIRTLVIILFLAKAKDDTVIYAVIISTVITTVCGMWLAYGEPPNLIMKANLHPHLDDAFFLRYCLPAAVGSWMVVAWNISRRLKGRKVDLKKLDLLDRHTADVRFLQASRHGQVLTAVEFVDGHKGNLGSHFDPVVRDLHQGVPLGEAMVNQNVPKPVRLTLLAAYTADSLAETLDDYYVHVYGKNDHKADDAALRLAETLEDISYRRQRAQFVGLLSFLPFVGLLVTHALHHEVSLFWASGAGFAVAFLAVSGYPKTRKLAMHEAVHEFKEYLFLLPLFLSITLLQKTGFFSVISDLLHLGVEKLGAAHMAYGQFWFCTVLSALLDNNVVADFAARALHGLDAALIHLFAMAQIAGYALGGCWTHVGSAQSVVAYAFIQREINPRYTPFQWIKAMTSVILQIAAVMTVLIYLEGWLIQKGLFH